jgi:hypothetical protein
VLSVASWVLAIRVWVGERERGEEEEEDEEERKKERKKAISQSVSEKFMHALVCIHFLT